MQLGGNTVLITGGASGIGLALAERFVRAGSKVLVCGRREGKLEELRQRHPEIETRVCDVSKEADRHSLADWAVQAFPELNVLVNNAGIQQRMQFPDAQGWDRVREEIATNLEAPIHLAMLLIPHLLQRPRAAIVNVTSGLAFMPLSRVPVYCATKAALHSWTLSLRYQLSGTPVQVIEMIPPAVDTDLGGPGLHTFGVKTAALLDDMLPRIEAGELEVAHGFAAKSSRASRQELDLMFVQMNAPAG